MNHNSRSDKFEELYFSEDKYEDVNPELNFEENLNNLLKNFYSEWKTCNVDLSSGKEIIKPMPKKNQSAAITKKDVKKQSDKGEKPEQTKPVHKDHRKRVREKFLKYGLETFTDFEVLELLLFYAIPQRDTNVIAHKLIDEFGSIKGVMNAEYYDLMEVAGISEISASLITLHREISKYIRTKTYESVNLSSSYISGRFCCDYFKSHTEESFILIFLNDDNYVENIVVISNGVENETAFYPRRVLKQILRHRTTKFMLAHNHPGDSAEPSNEDVVATTKLLFSLDELGVSLKDHIICAGDNFVSMSDRGLLDIKNENIAKLFLER